MAAEMLNRVLPSRNSANDVWTGALTLEIPLPP